MNEDLFDVKEALKIRSLYRLGYCTYCGENIETDGVYDHFYPLHRYNGVPEYKGRNIKVYSCITCNEIKWDRYFKTFDEAQSYIVTMKNKFNAEIKDWNRKCIRFGLFDEIRRLR